MYSYSVVQWLIFFFIYCFLGWCVESTIVSVKQKKLVNRGFVRGPVLPIYGCGAMMILVCTLPFRHNVLLVYLLGMLGATILEYITGCLMEAILKVRYWDYSKQFMNLNGHICLKCSLFWGVLSVVLMFIVHKPIEWVVLHMNPVISIILLSVISAVFLVDFYISAKTALNLAAYLTKLQTLREEISSLAYQIRGEAEVTIDDIKQGTIDSIREYSENIKNELEEKKVSKRKEMDVRIAVLQAEKEEMLSKVNYLTSQLIKSHPTATAHKFNGALEEVRERIENRIHK